MNLWLPKLEYAENMLLNEDRTDLRTDVKLISQLVKKQPELFDQTVHYVSFTQPLSRFIFQLECFDSELISVILDKTLREIQARFVTNQSHIFLSMEPELYRVKMARSSGLPDAKNSKQFSYIITNRSFQIYHQKDQLRTSKQPVTSQTTAQWHLSLTWKMVTTTQSA